MKRIAQLFVLFFALQGSIHVAVAAMPNVDAEGKPFPSLSPMLKRVNTAVVNISTYSTQRTSQNPLQADPFFRHFFSLPELHQYQQQQPKKRQRSAGSGVIVDSDDGIVITNYHVIKDSDEVRVSLTDGRSFEARILGSDPELDIAVLEIDGDDLSEVGIADSNDLEVGDFVVAIGNPFGIGQTVTTGIVSALGRSGLGIEGYENFIQTDASINPGNSGGALVNLAGELVGINTAIIAPAGGNVGIGFAIPTNMATASMQQIIDHGEVRRGLIGVGIQDISHDLREAFDLANGQTGVLVSSVGEDSPAEKAGIQAGDIILTVEGEPTQTANQLRSQIGMKTVGEDVHLTLLREGEEMEISVEVGPRDEVAVAQNGLHQLLEGASFENNTDESGVVVTRLEPGSKAAYSGLRVGDTVVAANRKPVTNLESFRQALKSNSKGILLRVNRGGGALFLAIR